MLDTGRWLIIAGLSLAAAGAVIWLLGRSGFRGLPGDISYQSDHVRFYFPIATCLLLSLLLTGVMWLWRWFGRK
jgi:hypothetical protein